MYTMECEGWYGVAAGVWADLCSADAVLYGVFAVDSRVIFLFEMCAK